MKITFLTERKSDDDYYGEKHSILVNEKAFISQRESMEPEDVLFCRDLSSPHQIKPVFLKIIEAIKNGETIEFEEIEKEWE